MPTREPSLAELARTALADASAATLVTTGCPTPGTLTVVPVEDQPDGRPLIRLERSSPAVRLLASCPVATLSLPAPAPYRALDLVGPLNPCRPGRDGTRTYRLSLLSARLVGTTAVPVPLSEFHAAAPDPLRGQASAALSHLEEWHAEELLACVRAHGCEEVQAVVPRALDRYGIELAVLCPDAVRRVRLDFPGGPVDNLDQVTTDLRILLTCRCQG